MNFKKAFKEFRKEFKEVWKAELSNTPNAILQREQKKENGRINEQKELANAMPDGEEKNKEIKRIEKAEKTPKTIEYYQRSKDKTLEKRNKNWADRGFRTYGVIIGAAIGIAASGGIGGIVLGAVLGVAAGYAIQKAAVRYGIPMHKVAKKIPSMIKNAKEKSVVKVNRISVAPKVNSRPINSTTQKMIKGVSPGVNTALDNSITNNSSMSAKIDSPPPVLDLLKYSTAKKITNNTPNKSKGNTVPPKLDKLKRRPKATRVFPK